MTAVAGLSGILIAGTSHVGKTTLAKRLAEALGWDAVSTDSLGRHPGRPWPDVRLQVVEFYTRLSPETIDWFLKVHHDNMWPCLQRLIENNLRAEKPFVLEGSALRPEFVAPMLGGRIAGICLYADDDFLRERMRSEARWGRLARISAASWTRSSTGRYVTMPRCALPPRHMGWRSSMPAMRRP